MNPKDKELITNFLYTFPKALTHASQYTTRHQLAASSIEGAFDLLLTVMGRCQTLSIMMIEGRIVANGEPLEDSLHGKLFLQHFTNHGIQHLQFAEGVTLPEFRSFIEMLTTGIPSLREAQSFPHIQFGTVEVEYETPETAEWADVIPDDFYPIHTEDRNLMTEVYGAVKQGRSLPDREIKQIVTNIISAIRVESSVLLAFSPLRVLDEYTFTHSTNVCILNIAQAMALGMGDDLLHDIGVAALLHDTGKLFVPEEVLNKPGRLDEREWELIRLHPQKGAEYLIDKPGIPPLAVVVAYEHHMQYDYSGYPRVLEKRPQNVCSQMTAISDYFDALRTKRVYRDAVETKTIAEQMANMAGTSLHPVLTKNFLVLIEHLLAVQEARDHVAQ